MLQNINLKDYKFYIISKSNDTNRFVKKDKL